MRQRMLVPACVLAACLLACGEDREAGSPAGGAPAAASPVGPERPVAGRVGGHEFRPDLVQLVDGTLVFRHREWGEPYLVLALRGVPTAPARLDLGPGDAGIAVEITTKTEDDLLAETRVVRDDRTLRLVLDAPEAGRVAGRIEVVVPGEEETRLAGAFVAELPRPPAPEEGPAVFGRVDHPVRDDRTAISVGYVGEKDGGGWLLVNVPLAAMGWPYPADATNTTFDPRLSTIAHDPWAGYTYRHVRLEPGWYLVYARERQRRRLLDWRWVRVEAAGAVEADLRLRPDAAGALEVTVGPPVFDTAERRSLVKLIPLDASGGLPPLRVMPDRVFEFVAGDVLGRQLDLEARVVDGRASFSDLGPGRYRVVSGELVRGETGRSGWDVLHTADVVVPAGETVRVELPGE